MNKEIKNKLKISVQQFNLKLRKQALIKRIHFEEAMEQKGVDLDSITYEWKGPECRAETIEEEFTVKRKPDVTKGSTSLLNKPFKWSTQRKDRMKNKLFFNQIISMSLESIIQLTMTGMLYYTISQAANINFTVEQGRLTLVSSNITGILSIIILMSMVSVSLLFVFLPSEVLLVRSVFRRISNLYDHLDLAS